MKPNFDTPATTFRQILDRNITLLTPYFGGATKAWLAESDVKELRELAETMYIIPKEKMGDQVRGYSALTKKWVLEDGTHTMLFSFPNPGRHKWGVTHNHGRGWWKGEQLPLGWASGYFSSKQWHLNEEFKNLKFQVQAVKS